ncbi:MAG: hypothetical protein IKP95_04100 [Ruminococcus sp.]|nr:hypothetical protein [Ruminococcus sp.]
MEILIGFVIIVVVLVMLGVSVYFIMECLIALLLLALAATLVFFIWTGITLIGSRVVKGHYLRIDKPERGFPSAVYDTPEGEVRNTFPCEMIFRSALYKPEREVRIRMTKRGKAYDRYSVITIITGLLLGSVSLYYISSYISVLFGIAGVTK